ncbi:MAG: hypothetical protein HY554_11060 [Elusimicrobia bacterium]|nr:hypothetical protein [Elusimicrobiota bacterium]
MPSPTSRWLRVYGWLFAASGTAFVAAPGLVSAALGLLASACPGARGVEQGLPTFWLALTGSLMAVIAVLALGLARDPSDPSAWRGLLLSKAASTALFCVFAATEGNALFLAGALVDCGILLHLASLCRASREAGEEAPRFETWFVRARDPVSGAALWLRHCERRGPGAGSELWWTLFDPASSGTLAGRAAEPGGEGRRLPPPGALSPASLYRRSGDAAWELDWSPLDAPPFRFAPLVSAAGLSAASYEVPAPWAVADGTVTLGGKRFVFSRAEASSGHISGRRGARAWRWLHACVPAAEGPPTVLEALSARVDSWPFGWLTGVHLWHRGRHLRADGPLALVRNASRREDRTWSLAADLGALRLEARCGPDLERLARIEYREGDGTPVTVRTSMTGWVRLTLQERGGAPETLESRASAAVEFGGAEAW